MISTQTKPQVLEQSATQQMRDRNQREHPFTSNNGTRHQPTVAISRVMLEAGATLKHHILAAHKIKFTHLLYLLLK